MLAVKTGGHSLNEKRLFHGTSPDAVEAICKQNFDWRSNGKITHLYVEGSHFAVNASYSDAFAKKDANSSQFMFLAKVLVGSYTKGNSSYRRPPPKQPSNPSSDLFDSCVDDQYSPTIYVVFDADQFYPEYIIEYSDESSRYSGGRGAPSSARAGAYAAPSFSRATPSRSSVNPTKTESMHFILDKERNIGSKNDDDVDDDDDVDNDNDDDDDDYKKNYDNSDDDDDVDDNDDKNDDDHGGDDNDVDDDDDNNDDDDSDDDDDGDG
ncbi:TCDD-inducible poly [ADP-ribose] polymerase [Stylophora pistillata]|uniref:Poly [ADP-ribose] polymerase n=1 Tax=Stylophora pistillata TaxID=50429 RepID=A0A2B4RK65_STYPI|nr:TCDD-inducible poly [ADP-ribose] polymerase [Stylophora pistillata]